MSLQPVFKKGQVVNFKVHNIGEDPTEVYLVVKDVFENNKRIIVSAISHLGKFSIMPTFEYKTEDFVLVADSLEDYFKSLNDQFNQE